MRMLESTLTGVLPLMYKAMNVLWCKITMSCQAHMLFTASRSNTKWEKVQLQFAVTSAWNATRE